VSRSFGDFDAKLPQEGGNPNVLISTPEIISFQITNETDFVVMGCNNLI